MAITLKAFKFKNLKKKGKQKLFVVPFLFTFANAVFGLLSVIRTIEGDFSGAAYCIILAAVMDFFDGKLARVFGSTSFLGMELDSLCDAVSFCFAPAILLYGWKFSELRFFGVLLVISYLCCGLLRLAKFNVISLNKEQKLTYFIGLPTTMAAFLIATMVIRFDIISIKVLPFLQNNTYLAIFVAIISYLMISPIKFLSLKKVNTKLLFIALVLGIVLYVPSYIAGLPAIFLGVLSYVIASVVYYFLIRFSEVFEKE